MGRAVRVPRCLRGRFRRGDGRAGRPGGCWLLRVWLVEAAAYAALFAIIWMADPLMGFTTFSFFTPDGGFAGYSRKCWITRRASPMRSPRSRRRTRRAVRDRERHGHPCGTGRSQLGTGHGAVLHETPRPARWPNHRLGSAPRTAPAGRPGRTNAGATRCGCAAPARPIPPRSSAPTTRRTPAPTAAGPPSTGCAGSRGVPERSAPPPRSVVAEPAAADGSNASGSAGATRFRWIRRWPAGG
jgi:hypothetical protein